MALRTQRRYIGHKLTGLLQRGDARIGILINNAGTTIGGSFIEQSTDDVARLLALNTTAVLRLASAIRPIMDRVFPFRATNEALAYLDTGRSKGKVVVQLT